MTRALVVRWVIGFFLIGVPTAVFVDLAGDVWLKEGFAWDAPIMLAVHSVAQPWLNTLMLAITQLGSYGVAAVTIGAVAWLWLAARRLDAITLLASVIGASLIDAGLKLLFQRPRPDVFPPLVSPTSFSFPSGHSLVSAALYGLLAIFLWRYGRCWWAVLSGAVVFVVGFSRVYLGAHYPSDVLASWALGTLWLVAVMLAHDWAARRWPAGSPEG